MIVNCGNFSVNVYGENIFNRRLRVTFSKYSFVISEKRPFVYSDSINIVNGVVYSSVDSKLKDILEIKFVLNYYEKLGR